MRRLVVITATLALVGLLAAPAHAASLRSDLWRLSDGTQVSDAVATLLTNGSGARMTLQTSGLESGHSVTLWWVVFNSPENCTHGGALRCGEDDLFVEDVQGSVAYAAGHVIGGSGRGNFAASLSMGDTRGALFGPGLIAPTEADVFLVVRDHGPATDPSSEIHNFGFCNPECVDQQIAVFEQ